MQYQPNEVEGWLILGIQRPVNHGDHNQGDDDDNVDNDSDDHDEHEADDDDEVS